MLTTKDFCELLFAKTNTRTVYALAKYLGRQQTTVSRWVKGAGAFGDDEAVQVAEILELPAEYVLACCAAERTKSPAARSAFERVADSLRTSMAALVAALCVAGISIPERSYANERALVPAVGLYIMRSVRGALRLGSYVREFLNRASRWTISQFAPLRGA